MKNVKIQSNQVKIKQAAIIEEKSAAATPPTIEEATKPSPPALEKMDESILPDQTQEEDLGLAKVGKALDAIAESNDQEDNSGLTEQQIHSLEQECNEEVSPP